MVEGSGNSPSPEKDGGCHDPSPSCSHHILRQHPAILGNLDDKSISNIRGTRKPQELEFYTIEFRVTLPPTAHLVSVRLVMSVWKIFTWHR